MAQTRAITRKKLAALGALDFLSRALHGISRPHPSSDEEPRSFLVVEPWGIGDVVLATPLLQALRANFPRASITLLAKTHALPLLEHSGLADDIISFDFPWTAHKGEGKYSPARYKMGELRRLIQRLRARQFDVSLDARRDIRSNVITYLAGARRRIGYDFGGGAHLLTDVLASGAQDAHKVDDWLELLGPLGIPAGESFRPRLAVTPAEREQARAALRLVGVTGSRPIIGVHPGASHAVRRWKAERFSEVIDSLIARNDSDVVLFEGAGADSGIAGARTVPRMRTGLRELMALITQCDLLVCSDSGPMHLAGALGVPVTALFGPQRSEWYGPRGELDSVVRVDVMPCRPCFDECIFASPICMDGITPMAVTASIVAHLERLAAVASTHGTGQISILRTSV
ncbi:MAG: glycosyltransferase family 9 protein [Gemmatimonadota bacterium]|nr:glycosyltransferase family 9 protein [Gemmatimonadota bacterium]